MAIGEQDVLRALGAVKYPGFTRDIVSFGIVRAAEVADGVVRVLLELGSGNPAVAPTLEKEVRSAIAGLPGVRDVEVRIASGPAGAPGSHPSPATAGVRETALLREVSHTIAVASGKGGVGKSTVAVNLAIALARRGSRVGLLDADIYGPSIPMMMGVNEAPRIDRQGRRILPFERDEVRFMSLGFLVERDTAVIWRGPMVMKAVEQLLRDVEWGALDVLVVDMPPGTGDAQLTLSQKVRLSGAVIVTTPQDVALTDATKGVAMFRKVGVPVLGIVENMSYFACPHCGERTDVFGHGGGRTEAERLGVPFLGEIPLDPMIRTGGDAGSPLVASHPESPQTAAFLRIADVVLAELEADRGDEDAARSGGLMGWIRRGSSRATE